MIDLDTLRAILELLGPLLISIITFFLGQRWERHRQSLIIRSQMLQPIEQWLQGAERMIGIVGDTVISVTLNSAQPVTYNLEERRRAAQAMIEKSNIVIGILQSNSLRIWTTRKLAGQLADTIMYIEYQLKQVLVPLDIGILEHDLAGTLTRDFLTDVGEVNAKLQMEIRKAHMLIAQLKTAFT